MSSRYDVPDANVSATPEASNLTGSQATDSDQSLGTLVSQLSTDLSRLMQQELALAKAEMRDEAKKAGKAAGMLGGAGFAGYMVALFASLAIMWALDEAMDLVWAALIVTAIWAIVGAVLFVVGRKKLRQVNPKPEQTIQTLKEDKQWAKHPTS